MKSVRHLHVVNTVPRFQDSSNRLEDTDVLNDVDNNFYQARVLTDIRRSSEQMLAIHLAAM
jgi:hypothetical protein